MDDEKPQRERERERERERVTRSMKYQEEEPKHKLYNTFIRAEKTLRQFESKCKLRFTFAL